MAASIVEVEQAMEASLSWSVWGQQLFAQAFSAFFVFGAVFQYLPQYFALGAGKGGAFSPMIPLVLLHANLLRLFFRLGKPFEDVLVYQSLVMITVQLLIMEVCVRKRTERLPPGAPRRRFFLGRGRGLASSPSGVSLASAGGGGGRGAFAVFVNDFWQWDTFSSYLIYLVAFSSFVAVLCALFIRIPLFVDLLGYAALMTEATLGVPQAIRNSQVGTEGLSSFLIWSWFFSDVVKTFWFWTLLAPSQFVACGVFQIVVDLVILFQITKERTGVSQPPRAMA